MGKDKQLRRGSMTVFLAGILLVLLTFLLALFGAARFYAVRVETESAVVMGMDSVFAEYNRALLEQYELFFIDTGYGFQNPSYHRTAGHLEGYIRSNLMPEEDALLIHGRSFLGMESVTAAVTQASVATDDGGADLHYQAVEYMRDYVGLEFVEDLQNQYAVVCDYDMDSRDIEAEADQVQSQIDAAELPQEQLADGSWSDVPVDNPAEDVNRYRFRGILDFVVADSSTLSELVIQPDNYASNRSLNTGTGAAASYGGITDEILFQEYILRQCGSYTEPGTAGELQYETEYILAGKNSDIENLKWVAGRLIMVREVANTVYLFTDQTKMAEADALAWGLSIVSLSPELQPFIKTSILLAWAYAESVQDVRTLLSGGEVPLLKNAQSWKLSLTNMLQFGDHLSDDEGEGLDYRMYLRFLLLMEDREQKTLRLADVIEMNVRKTEGNASFRMDGCIDALTAQVETTGSFGEKFTITRSYSYLNR